MKNYTHNDQGQNPLSDMNPGQKLHLKIFLFVTGAVVIGFIGFIVILFLGAGKLIGLFSHEKEVEFFQDKIVFSQNLKKNSLDDMNTSHIRFLWENKEKTQINFKVRKSTSLEPNAYTSLGGNFFVTQGLSNMMTTKNSMAFVLCHELGHFYHRHILKSSAFKIGLGLLGTLIGMPFIESVFQLQDLKFSRDNERQADKYALQCMNSSYGHINGYDLFFEQMKKKEGLSQKLFKFFQTHPLSEERLEDLSNYAKKQGYKTSGKLIPMNSQDQMILLPDSSENVL